MYELLIKNGKTIYQPAVEEGITWTTDLKGTPSDLKFKYIGDGKASIEEGNAVTFKVDKKEVFFGFLFTRKHQKDMLWDATCYDQLRYFKNKDTYVYKNKRADQVIRMLATDFGMKVGTLDNTKFVLPSRVEENSTLFDMAQNALDLTMQHTKKMYVLYDKYGKLTLKNIGNNKVNILIDPQTGENYSYEVSIDQNTYNKVKLTYDNKDTGKREVYIAKSTASINKWGVLQYFEKVQNKENVKSKVNSLLNLYNQKTRTLTVKNAFGDIRVRAGVLIPVKLNLGDINIINYMLVTKAKHTFKNGEHFMDLTLRGGKINA